MIDDLIYFGIDHNIPEEKGLNFLFRMYKAYGRNIKRFLEPLQGITKTKQSKFTPKKLPNHLRRKNNE